MDSKDFVVVDPADVHVHVCACGKLFNDDELRETFVKSLAKGRVIEREEDIAKGIVTVRYDRELWGEITKHGL